MNLCGILINMLILVNSSRESVVLALIFCQWLHFWKKRSVMLASSWKAWQSASGEKLAVFTVVEYSHSLSQVSCTACGCFTDFTKFYTAFRSRGGINSHCMQQESAYWFKLEFGFIHLINKSFLMGRKTKQNTLLNLSYHSCFMLKTFFL